METGYFDSGFLGYEAADADGYPLTDPQLALIDCPLPEAQVRRRFPAFWSYLETGKKEGIAAGYLASRRLPWYRQGDRPAAPFLCTSMGRCHNGKKPCRFLCNKSQATAPNVYLLLYPRLALQALWEEKAGLYGLLFEALRGLDTDGFTHAGRVYGGGLYQMEPKELMQVSAETLFDALPGHWAGAGMPRGLPF